jgi:hypothetical protein
MAGPPHRRRARAALEHAAHLRAAAVDALGPTPGQPISGLRASGTPPPMSILSERIGHADVGFFLQTYAHVITNDDREAAEQAASFLIGDGWDPEPDDEQG